MQQPNVFVTHQVQRVERGGNLGKFIPWGAKDIVVKSVCSARDLGWGGLGDWGWGIRETIRLKTQDAVAIKESK